MSILNFHYSRNEYPMFLQTLRIGTFIEEFNPKRTVSIELNDLVMNNLLDPRFVYFSQYEKGGRLDDKATREWINRRVFPKTRQNGDQLLKEMGLSEYDQIEIFKKNEGGCCKDSIWVQFTEMTFEELYPEPDRILDNPIFGCRNGFKSHTWEEFGFSSKAIYSNRNDRGL